MANLERTLEAGQLFHLRKTNMIKMAGVFHSFPPKKAFNWFVLNYTNTVIQRKIYTIASSVSVTLGMFLPQ
jgi:hypothetical protein